MPGISISKANSINELHDLSDEKFLPTASFFHNACFVRFALALLIETSASMFREESPGEKLAPTGLHVGCQSVEGNHSV